MTLLRGSILILIAILGVTQPQNLNDLKPLISVEDIDLEYRPWDHNDTSTTWISLYRMGLEEINSMFRLNIPNLRWLVMDENRIQSILSESFKSFRDLTYLSLARNRINEFRSNAFDGLDKLQILDLDGNPIGMEPNSVIFSTLAELKRLYLRNCGMFSFDLPPHMDHLSRLYLSGNQLQLFYTSHESALTHLYLNNNQLRYVSLSKFGKLIHLDLSNNQLVRIMRQSEVPSSYYARNYAQRGYYGGTDDDSGLYIDEASALQHLIVSFNELSEINQDTFRDTEALIYVDLTNNKITEVYGGTFNNLPQVENILLDSNKIQQINHRAFVNLPNLKIISLKNNQIDEVDGDAFTKLNSSANELYLFLDNNLIHTLSRGSFKGIKGLKHIGLSSNRIKTISSEAFVNLPNLQSIVIENQSHEDSVDRSHLDEITMRIPVMRKGLIESDAFFNLSNLTSITIRGNLFRTIQAQAFHHLPKLTTLDLSNNNVATLSPKAFCDLPELENLYLGHNLISRIEPDTFPKQLKYLNLASNQVCPEFSCWHVGELYQLRELDVSGIIERFTIDDFTGLSKNLTVIVGKAGGTPNLPVPCY